MKKIRQPLSQHFSSLNLFREDVETIVSVIAKSCKEIKIQDEEYRYKDISEIVEKRGISLKKLTITGRKPHISFTFSKMTPPNFSLYSANIDKNAEFIYLKLKDMLEQKKNPFRYFFHPIVVISCWLFMLFGSTPSVIYTSKINIWVYAIFSGLIIGLGLGSWMGLSPLSSIKLEYKKNVDNFLSRNKDKLIVGIILFIITGILGLFIRQSNIF